MDSNKSNNNTINTNQCTISTYGIIFMSIISIQVLLFYSNLYNSEYYILELDMEKHIEPPKNIHWW